MVLLLFFVGEIGSCCVAHAGVQWQEIVVHYSLELLSSSSSPVSAPSRQELGLQL